MIKLLSRYPDIGLEHKNVPRMKYSTHVPMIIRDINIEESNV